MAGLRVGQAYGGVPRSLSTQPPFATQALREHYGSLDSRSERSSYIIAPWVVINGTLIRQHVMQGLV